MKYLKQFGCGILIGLSCLIPGFSGGTTALILGIYEELMDNIALITKKFFTAFKALWAIGLGIILGVVLGLVTIVKCLNNWPLITSGFFVGLVIATIPLVVHNMHKEKSKISSWISFSVCALISLVLCFSDKIGLTIDVSKPSIFIIIFITLITAIGAAMMLIPAASGALVLLMFGLFEPSVVALESSLAGIINGDFSILVSYLYIIIPLIIGGILGVLAVGKIISMIFKKWENQLWHGILGLLVVSVFAIIYNAFHDPLHPEDTTRFDNITNNLTLNIIGAILMLILGFVILTYIVKKIDQKTKKLDDTSSK